MQEEDLEAPILVAKPTIAKVENEEFFNVENFCCETHVPTIMMMLMHRILMCFCAILGLAMGGFIQEAWKSLLLYTDYNLCVRASPDLAFKVVVSMVLVKNVLLIVPFRYAFIGICRRNVTSEPPQPTLSCNDEDTLPLMKKKDHPASTAATRLATVAAFICLFLDFKLVYYG
ncbi:hypothetical protein ACA910_020959 [Epithemia clementina (nom. ined.)]